MPKRHKYEYQDNREDEKDARRLLLFLHLRYEDKRDFECEIFSQGQCVKCQLFWRDRGDLAGQTFFGKEKVEEKNTAW